MKIRHIVCCTDFSDHSQAAFETASEMAEKYRARLTVLHVLPPIVNPIVGNSQFMVPEKARTSLLQQLQEQMQAEYGDKINKQIDYQLKILEGHVSTEIVRFLEEEKADVAILGAFGASGMGLVLFGSVAKRVAHRAHCSVMIVR
jgi:universal stress protein A